MNDAKIRIQAEMIAANIQSIAAIASQLRRSYKELYEELKYADPQRDRQFETFMLRLSRTIHALHEDQITDLAIATADMREFVASGPAGAAGSAVAALAGRGPSLSTITLA